MSRAAVLLMALVAFLCSHCPCPKPLPPFPPPARSCDHRGCSAGAVAGAGRTLKQPLPLSKVPFFSPRPLSPSARIVIRAAVLVQVQVLVAHSCGPCLQIVP